MKNESSPGFKAAITVFILLFTCIVVYAAFIDDMDVVGFNKSGCWEAVTFFCWPIG